MFLYGFNYTYILLIVVTLVIGLCTSGYVNSTLRKNAKVPVISGLTGAEVASRMLAYYNISNVAVIQGRPGEDHYDPRRKVIALNPDAYNGRSITATATACHEAGHACQHAMGYVPMRVRTAVVPAVNIASNAWIFILMIGIFMNLAGLIDLAIILYAIAVAFQLITLPVELNASHRAMVYMNAIGINESEQACSFSVLRACALTYVAAALTSVLQLLWLLGQRR